MLQHPPKWYCLFRAAQSLHQGDKVLVLRSSGSVPHAADAGIGQRLNYEAFKLTQHVVTTIGVRTLTALLAMSPPAFEDASSTREADITASYHE